MTSNNSSRWFIAYVKSCQERRVAEILEKMGVEYYLPMQREVHKWSDRRKIVVRLIIPHIVFVKVTELVRRELLKSVYGIHSYMMDRATGRPAVVPDHEMKAFRMMVEHSGAPVAMNSEPLVSGDLVRVISGPLCGMEYELAEVHGNKCIVTRIDFLGSAFVEFDESNLEKIG